MCTLRTRSLHVTACIAYREWMFWFFLLCKHFFTYRVYNCAWFTNRACRTADAVWCTLHAVHSDDWRVYPSVVNDTHATLSRSWVPLTLTLLHEPMHSWSSTCMAWIARNGCKNKHMHLTLNPKITPRKTVLYINISFYG